MNDDQYCFESEDHNHCNCWWDGEECHYCGAETEIEEKDERTENTGDIHSGQTELSGS